MNSPRLGLLIPLAGITALACMAGCAALGYSLGTSLPPGIRTVHVPTFVNKTGEPLLEAEATAAAVREFQRDLTLEVADRNTADTIVEVTLNKAEPVPVLFDKNNPKLTTEYRLRIDAEAIFKMRVSGKVLRKFSVYGEAKFLPGGDLGNAKRAALPSASSDLAHQIVKNVVEFWGSSGGKTPRSR